MNDKILAFKQHVKDASSNPNFLHHKWFVKWHLEVVEKIALELLGHYPKANRELAEIMVWLHDYGKILDFNNEYSKTLTAGREKLTELDFPPDIVDTAVSYIEILDKKLTVDLYAAPIEIQIVSSADGCSHMTGPFLNIFWNENTDQTFKGKTYEELMALNLAKIEKDWKYKIVLPEARKAFEPRYQFLKEHAGQLPDKYF